MDIGFIGLGKMGLPMARRLIEAKHQLVVFDQRKEAVDRLVALGAQTALSPKEVAERTDVSIQSTGEFVVAVIVKLLFAQIVRTKTRVLHFDMVVGIDINIILQVDNSFSLE